MQTIIISGNCQAKGLRNALANAIFDQPTTVKWLKAFEEEHLPGDAVSSEDYRNCRLLLLQEGSWHNEWVSFDQLPASCPVVRFPNLALNALWPLAFRDPRNAQNKLKGFTPYPFGAADSLAHSLLLKGIAEDEIVRQYMATDLNDLVDLDRFAEMHDEKFTSIDAKCDIKLWDYVKGNFRTKHLFRTNNHPSGVLMAYTLHRILAASPLGEWIQNSGTVLESTAASFGIGAFEDPIHPQVIDHFSLNYLGKDYKYKYRFEGAFDFESRLRRYLRFDYNEHALSLTSAVHAGNIEKIREHALDAIVRQPDSWYVYYCLATVFQNLGRREDELRSLLIAKRFANGQWAVHQRLAQHYRKYGMRAQALEEQETALRLEPYRGVVHFQYGLILADANERERAGAAFARAYELEPNNPKIAARRPAPLPASGVRQEDL